MKVRHLESPSITFLSKASKRIEQPYLVLQSHVVSGPWPLRAPPDHGTRVADHAWELPILAEIFRRGDMSNLDI